MGLYDSGCGEEVEGVRTVADTRKKVAAVDTYMTATDREISTSRIPTERKKLWGTVYAKWRDFFAGTHGNGIARLDAYDRADRFQQLAHKFGDELNGIGHVAPVMPIIPVPEPFALRSAGSTTILAGGKSSLLKWLLIGGGVAAGSYFAWKWWRKRRSVAEISETVQVVQAPPVPQPVYMPPPQFQWPVQPSRVYQGGY